MEYEEYLEDIEQALREVHAGAEGVLEQWAGDVEMFVKDHLDMIRATYEAGYWDALDQVEESTQKLKRDFAAQTSTESI